jgi:hypothetical protein
MYVYIHHVFIHACNLCLYIHTDVYIHVDVDAYKWSRDGTRYRRKACAHADTKVNKTCTRANE